MIDNIKDAFNDVFNNLFGGDLILLILALVPIFLFFLLFIINIIWFRSKKRAYFKILRVIKKIDKKSSTQENMILDDIKKQTAKKKINKR